MIRALLLEDNQTKAVAVGDHIRSNYPNEIDLVTCSDSNTARRYLKDEKFDVVIIDIQVPATFDRNPDPIGGIQLIKGLANTSRYQYPTHVIALTAYAESARQAEQDLGPLLTHVLEYSPTSDEWKAKLSSMLDRVLLSCKANGIAREEFKADVAVICALRDPELNAVLDLPWSWSELQTDGDSTTYWTGQVTGVGWSRPLNVVAAYSPLMGMTACSVVCAKLICHFRPRFLLMPGIAAGIRGRANIGDVLVAEHTWDYSSGKWMEDETGALLFEPDPHPVALETGIRDWFQQLSHDHSRLDAIKRRWRGPAPGAVLNLHVGPIASGPAVVATKHITEEVRGHARKLLGIDMEAHAVCYTASNAIEPRPTAVCIKAVSDFADTEKHVDGTDNNRTYAAFTSAQTLSEFVLTCPSVSRDTFSS